MYKCATEKGLVFTSKSIALTLGEAPKLDCSVHLNQGVIVGFIRKKEVTLTLHVAMIGRDS